MRITDDRYSRDRSRIDLALRFIRHEARTHTIRDWTGLSDDRIRKLYRTYLADSGPCSIQRHRGKSPSQSAFFTRSGRMRRESGALASLMVLFGAVPLDPAPDHARSVAGVIRGSLLCEAFERYRHLVNTPSISFEHAVHLATELTRATELRVAPCRQCGALSLTERIELRAPLCGECSAVHALRRGAPCAVAPARLGQRPHSRTR
jgi:hypothetical protein